MNPNVILAIFKRNFSSYFANPTGYVFICAFVLISGFAAFWPHEFFNANLANLDQLNKFLPYIMLGFVPAITMSIWADERRQGTDELLLTLPGHDLDVVVGKYLAAVAIFSVSLLFSLSNVMVLTRLGDPDMGLLFANYFGYWLVGLAMVAIGMVASFLTANLTVGFVLGVAFNTPLVFAANADVFVSRTPALRAVKDWSIGDVFGDFGRGIISLAGLIYFAGLIAAGIYLSLVLIGRRHWVTGGGKRMLSHFVVRAVAVVVAAFALTVLARHFDPRIDVTQEKLSSLSPQTIRLLNNLDKNVIIEAFISPESEMPEHYVQTRLNLVTTLREIEKRSGGRIKLTINETESYKPEKTIAEERFGIRAQTRFSRDRGRFRQHEMFMGVGLTSGLDKEVIPFVDRGVPVEYELARAITSLADRQRQKLFDLEAAAAAELDKGTIPATVKEKIKSQRKIDLTDKAQLTVKTAGASWELVDGGETYSLLRERGSGDKDAIAVYRLPKAKTIGIVKTDMPMIAAGFNPMTMQRGEDEQIVVELRKMYEVVEVDPSQPIEKKYDLLLAVQPSTLDQTGIDNFIAAVKSGIPTAIFEDPVPVLYQGQVAGTTDEKQPPRPRMGMPPQPPSPKGNIAPLWTLLGVDFGGDRSVSQRWNPFPKITEFPPTFVFVGKGSGAAQPFNEQNPITSGLRHMMFLAPGVIAARPGSPLSYQPLVRTGTRATLIEKDQVYSSNPMNPFAPPRLNEDPQTYRYRLFDVPTALAVELDKATAAAAGPVAVPKDVVNRFITERSINLTPAATVTQQVAGYSWEIADGREVYLIEAQASEKGGDILRVYQSEDDDSTWLFDLPASLAAKLTEAADKAPPADVAAAFTQHRAITLGAGAKVAVEAAGDRWKITDGGVAYSIERDDAYDLIAYRLTSDPITVAAHIAGKPKDSDNHINVVLVADVDAISTAFINVRNAGENELIGAFLDVDNVPFTLNVIDSLAGDERFIEVRKRGRVHRTLTAFEKAEEESRKKVDEAKRKAAAEFNRAIRKEQRSGERELKRIIDELRKGEIDERQLDIKKSALEETLSKRLTVRREQLQRSQERKVKEAEAAMELSIRQMQNSEKRLAVFLPPVLPLLIGIGVFAWRRSRELEGAVKSRIRS
jgi:ABC-type uncharacterized transport system involved in gliding motility auxiliary subunit/ABC-type transport system involved in multi-copper enzyme maturation permease subunit